ncbi:MAG TPA: pyridoxamine kinase [Firmicutes bacterium]|nr:pyridoxamine kinase [Bacillota bacterium]
MQETGSLKRALAVHDLSGVGKCSLTVVLPVLSAAGVECAALPTAVLSTHTGGFGPVVCRDLTEEMLPFARHWLRERVTFDAVYTGYLSSPEQIQVVKDLFRMFRTGSGSRPLMLVDPVMGDNGRLYSLYTPEMARRMAELCAQADVIVPNLTEAAILLGREYRPSVNREEAAELMRALARLGPRQVVLTGVGFGVGRMGAACYDAGIGWVGFVLQEEIPGHFHGTGDLFASVLLAGLLHGKSLEASVRIAVNFTAESVRRTAAGGTEPRYGVCFEPGLSGLLEQMRWTDEF